MDLAEMENLPSTSGTTSKANEIRSHKLVLLRPDVKYGRDLTLSSHSYVSDIYQASVHYTFFQFFLKCIMAESALTSMTDEASDWLNEEINLWKYMEVLYETDTSLIDLLSIQPGFMGFMSNSDVQFYKSIVSWSEESLSKRRYNKIFGKVNTQQKNIRDLRYMYEGLLSYFDREQRNDVKVPPTNDPLTYEVIAKRAFKFIQCNGMKEALNDCWRTDTSWRSALIFGYCVLQAEYLDPWQKMDLRILWRKCIERVLKITTENPFFKGILGLLYGDIASVAKVCTLDWTELLHAHLKIQVDALLDRNLYPSGGEEYTPLNIMESIDSLIQIKPTPYQQCMRALITGSDFNITMRDDRKDHIYCSRFVAHLVLMLQKLQIRRHIPDGYRYIEIYLTNLISEMSWGAKLDMPILEFYLQQLPKHRQIKFCLFIGKVVNNRTFKRAFISTKTYRAVITKDYKNTILKNYIRNGYMRPL